MPKHENIRRCFSCEEKLALVDKDLVTWFLWIWEKFPGVHISWGFRNESDQTRMYKEGKSKEIYPFSKHNYISPKGKPEARAVDLFLLDDTGKAQFPEEWYLEIAMVSKDQDIKIRWGGDFPNFPDYNHFELIKEKE